MGSSSNQGEERQIFRGIWPAVINAAALEENKVVVLFQLLLKGGRRNPGEANYSHWVLINA